MEPEESEINFGFADPGTWNSTGHIALENMKIDAPMVIMDFVVLHGYQPAYLFGGGGCHDSYLKCIYFSFLWPSKPYMYNE